MQFTANISVVFTFTSEEVDYLASCAENHYDSDIRALVPPGPGAIINAMRNRLLPAGAGGATGTYSFREIDKLAKSIENHGGPVAWGLRRRFLAATTKINALTTAMNTLLDPSNYNEQ